MGAFLHPPAIAGTVKRFPFVRAFIFFISPGLIAFLLLS